MVPKQTEDFCPVGSLSFGSPVNKKTKAKHEPGKKKETHLMYTLTQFKTLASCVLVCFAFLPQMHAAPNAYGVPPPDGCYPGFTTAEGCNALANLTTGAGNTGIGWYSLFFAGSSSFSTGVGAGALVLNGGDSNTAVGAAALLLNTTGTENTAVGVDAMVYNGTGQFNNAFGGFALFSNTDGFSNNAVGDHALFESVHGAQNTAVGDLALANNDITGSGLGNFNTAVGSESLLANTNGDSNNAVGAYALSSNTTGVFNQAMGFDALGSNDTGAANVAIGDSALDSLHGVHSYNTVVGDQAGADLTAGDDNIYIGATAAAGHDVESGTIRIGDPLFVGACYIAGIANSTPNDGANVHVDANGRLTPSVSSARYKKDIKAMDKASESLLALKPVTFSYKNDAKAIQHYGLVAEEVAKVNADLVVVDDGGKPWSVRYDEVNAMLLNEFLKEHRKVEHLEKQVEKLTAGLQRVNDKLEMSKAAPQTVANSQ